MNDEPATVLDEPGNKKPPRKPRPSEIAAKAAKAAKKKKPAAKKTKPKAKPKTKKKPTLATRILKTLKGKKPKRKPGKAKKSGNNRPLVRTERMDLRLTKQERAKIMARVKKTDKTVTAAIMEAVAKAKW